MRENENRNAETTVEEGEIPARLGSDRFYRAMAARPRRRVLHHVLETDGCSLEELATVLSGWDAVEAGTVTDAGDRSERELLLRHVHLPVLAEADLVEYDGDEVDPGDLEPAVTSLVRRSVAAEGD